MRPHPLSFVFVDERGRMSDALLRKDNREINDRGGADGMLNRPQGARRPCAIHS